MTIASLSAKLVAGDVAAYALSPIDLIPDFVPILGYLDDLIIVPLGIILAIKLVPQTLMTEFRAQAELKDRRPTSRIGFIAILAIWLFCLILFVWSLADFF